MYTIGSLYLSLIRQEAFQNWVRFRLETASVWFLSSLSLALSVREGEMRKDACLNWLTSSQPCFWNAPERLIITSCFMKRTYPPKLYSNKLHFFIYRDSWGPETNSGCNGICNKANALLYVHQDSVCGCQEVLSMCSGVLVNNTDLTKDGTLTERSFSPWNPSIISTWCFLSSWQEKVHQLPSPLGKFKMFIHEFSFTSL